MEKRVMHLAFRCDANSQLGAGHLRRCAVLAEEALAKGCRVSFLAHTDGNPIWQGYLPSGAEATFAEGPAADGLGELVDWVKDIGADFLVVDHYELREQAVGEAGVRWMIFDNASGEGAIRASVVHNALPGISESDYAVRVKAAETKVLCGPGYALLRMEFREGHGRAEGGKRVAILFGGGSDRGMILRTVEALRGEIPDWERHVFVTSANDALDEIRTAEGVVLHVDEADVAGELAKSGLAVTAVGTTINELACLGVPSLCVAIADNQISGGERWGRTGATRYLGVAGDIGDGDLRGAVCELATDDEARVRMGEVARQLVDGCGARRTLDAIREASLILSA